MVVVVVMLMLMVTMMMMMMVMMMSVGSGSVNGVCSCLLCAYRRGSHGDVAVGGTRSPFSICLQTHFIICHRRLLQHRIKIGRRGLTGFLTLLH